MNKREIKIKTNNFKEDFVGDFIYDRSINTFVKTAEIDLKELCARYLLEEFDHKSTVKHYKEYPTLRFLLQNVKEFKFKAGQPGATKDAKKENSRVLGQTVCRYFIEKTFGNIYIANIGSLLDKKLTGEFSNIFVERVRKGDSPDYLFIDNNNQPCLAEAKGSRKPIEFSDTKFDKWREQFETVQVKVNNNPIQVKGYITEFGYFGVMMPVISVKPCHLKDHTII